MSRRAPVTSPVIDTIAERWSPRAFVAGAVPSEAEIASLFEAARWAASAFNAQPWRYIWGAKGSKTYDDILATLVPFNAAWAGNAGMLAIGIAETTRDGKENTTAVYDLGQATAHLVLQAAALGLAAHQVAGFDRDKARKIFAIPPAFLPMVGIVIGKRADVSVLADATLRERETAPRTRKPVGEFAFNGPWPTA